MKGSLIAPLILLNNLICPNQVIRNTIQDDNEDENEEDYDEGEGFDNYEGVDDNLMRQFLKGTVLNTQKT